MPSDESLQLLFQLSDAHAVPGAEQEVRDLFREHTSAHGDITVDRMGNIYCRREKAGRPHLVVDCHMDEVGFMVQSITPEGFLRVLGLGGWSTRSLVAQPVAVMGNNGKVPGIFGSLPPHFSKGKSNAQPDMEDLHVDIGATSESMVRDWGIRPGTPVCPDVRARHSRHADRVIGKAFDNRVGCGVCIEAAKSKEAVHANVTFVGAVQEEGGLRGAAISSRLSQADLAVILEGTPADDMPGVRSPASQGVLGKGVQIRCYDPTHTANSQLVDWAVRIAEQAAIPHQVAVRRSGGTNAGRYHLEGRGIPSLVLGVPARYIHSHQSMIDLNDYDATLALTRRILAEMDDETYRSILPH